MQNASSLSALLPHFLGGILLLLALLAGGLLLRRQREKKRLNPLTALLAKARAESGPGMQIQLCRKSLERLGPGSEPLLEALRQRQHTPVVRECLNRCNDCRLGQLMATADGIPIEAKDGDALLRSLDELD